MKPLPGFALLLGLALLPRPALAQDSALPKPGSWGIGGDIGYAAPLGAGEYDSDIQWDLFFEYFQTTNVSWRGMVSFFSFDGPELPSGGDDDIDIFVLSANASFQWDGKNVLPFITGGPGLYRYDARRGGTNWEFGVDFGAGANFYVSKSKKIAIKLEGVFHGTAGREPDSFFLLTAGVRAHF